MHCGMKDFLAIYVVHLTLGRRSDIMLTAFAGSGFVFPRIFSSSGGDKWGYRICNLHLVVGSISIAQFTDTIRLHLVSMTDLCERFSQSLDFPEEILRRVQRALVRSSYDEDKV